MLIIISGLPGVGKTTIGKLLAKKLQAVYLRVDSIEQAIRNAAQINQFGGVEQVFAEGYMAAYAVAKDNLELGLTVIADSVNSIEITREDYRAVADTCNKPYLEVEIICSDKDMHKQRVETRKPTLSGHKLPTWQDVLNRDFEKWNTSPLTIDTAELTADRAVEFICEELKN